MADLFWELLDVLPVLFVAALLLAAWLRTRKRERIRLKRQLSEFMADLAAPYLQPSDTDSAWLNRALMQAAVESQGGSLLDPSLRAMLAAAREKARQNCDHWVAPIHFLLALPKNDLVCRQVFSGHGLSAEDVRWRTREALILGQADQSPRRIPFSPEAAGVLVAAIREAKRLEHRSVWPGHILSAILAETGTAANVLRSLGITRETVERELVAREWAFR